jgi:hypothetical protein
MARNSYCRGSQRQWGVDVIGGADAGCDERFKDKVTGKTNDLNHHLV